MHDLDRFKREIDLRAYAEGLGYEPDKRDSWQGEYVMRKAGDKISVAFNHATGHWMYSSLRGDLSDRGTIIDFALRRRHYGYGELVQELQRWIGESPWQPPSAELKDLHRVDKDFSKVRRTWQILAPVPPHAYLEEERKIPAAVLMEDRFRGCVRGGIKNGNAAFPHYAVD